MTDATGMDYMDLMVGEGHVVTTFVPDSTGGNGNVNRSDSSARTVSGFDLRALEYPEKVDENLMCPICQVPFIEPVVLECDHMFCRQCLQDYSTSGLTNATRMCPTCRNIRHRSDIVNASRAVRNMCNDVVVKCPNDGCSQIMTRCTIEIHAVKTCIERLISCPRNSCDKKLRARNIVPGECIHISTVECECGKLIPLGRNDWLLHRDTECPLILPACAGCGEASRANHKCMFTRSIDERKICPGTSFGCDGRVGDDYGHHVSTCIFARLAPILSRQSQQIITFTDQVKKLQANNARLEHELMTSCKKVSSDLDAVIKEIRESDDIEEVIRPASQDYPQYRGRSRPRSPYPYPDTRAGLDIFPTPRADLVDDMFQTQGSEHFDPLRRHQIYLENDTLGRIAALENDFTNLVGRVAGVEGHNTINALNENARFRNDLMIMSAQMARYRNEIDNLINRQNAQEARERIAQAQQAQQARSQVRPTTSRTSTTPGASMSIAGPSNHRTSRGSSMTEHTNRLDQLSTSTGSDAMDSSRISHRMDLEDKFEAPGLPSEVSDLPSFSRMRRTSDGSRSRERVKL